VRPRSGGSIADKPFAVRRKHQSDIRSVAQMALPGHENGRAMEVENEP
jgi:hypothetical protein